MLKIKKAITKTTKLNFNMLWQRSKMSSISSPSCFTTRKQQWMQMQKKSTAGKNLKTDVH